jgi:hypothetical protein
MRLGRLLTLITALLLLAQGAFFAFHRGGHLAELARPFAPVSASAVPDGLPATASDSLGPHCSVCGALSSLGAGSLAHLVTLVHLLPSAPMAACPPTLRPSLRRLTSARPRAPPLLVLL